MSVDTLEERVKSSGSSCSHHSLGVRSAFRFLSRKLLERCMLQRGSALVPAACPAREGRVRGSPRVRAALPPSPEVF